MKEGRGLEHPDNCFHCPSLAVQSKRWLGDPGGCYLVDVGQTRPVSLIRDLLFIGNMCYFRWISEIERLVVCELGAVFDGP